jgi:alpha-glucosidase (family GH31 glycosyl hydrolase)
MKGAMRGGLSAAMTGDSFWSHDIGGFVGNKPSDELYIRWAQFGLLSPLSRFHGTTPREPWYYGSGALAVVKYYVNLRYTLIPYLLAAGQESVDAGLPILRPMILEFPDEPMIDQVDDQYLLGHDLLVAPVFRPGVVERAVYFPAGEWRRLEEPGEVVAGPGFRTVSAPLERVPVYVRAGAVIPYYAQAPTHLKGPTPTEWRLDIFPQSTRGFPQSTRGFPGSASRRLDIHEDGFELKIDYHADTTGSYLQVDPAPIDMVVRLVGRQAEMVLVNSVITQAEAAAGGAQFKLDARQGIVLVIKS